MADGRPLTDDQRDTSRARFARIVARPDPDIDLATAALIVAGYGRPPIDEGAVLDRLDQLADLVRLRTDAGDPDEIVAARLHDVLYREAGLRGPTAAEYGEPANSHLDRVLERRIGLPISLAVAWRIGLPLGGIGLPGHFIVGGPEGTLFDPAGGGRLLTLDDCQALIRRSVGEGVLLHAGMLRPVGRRQILARILRNLRTAHLAGA